MTHVLLLTRGFLLAALMLAPLAASAQQDRPDRTERLQRALDLSDAQVRLVQEAVGDAADAGDLWTVAAALTPTLTDAQKDKLFARPERKAGGERFEQGRRGEPGRRGNRPDRMQREAKEAGAKADMQAALNLTDAQMQQLETLRAERNAEREALREELRDADREARREAMQERRANRPEPGEVPGEIAAILTPAQQEVFAVHHALGAHVLRHRMHQMHRGEPRR